MGGRRFSPGHSAAPGTAPAPSPLHDLLADTCRPPPFLTGRPWPRGVQPLAQGHSARLQGDLVGDKGHCEGCEGTPQGCLVQLRPRVYWRGWAGRRRWDPHSALSRPLCSQPEGLSSSSPLSPPLCICTALRLRPAAGPAPRASLPPPRPGLLLLLQGPQRWTAPASGVIANWGEKGPDCLAGRKSRRGRLKEPEKVASFAQQLPPETLADYVSASARGGSGGGGPQPPAPASPQCGHCRPGERFILDEWRTGLLTKAAASRPRSVLSPAGEALDGSLEGLRRGRGRL